MLKAKVNKKGKMATFLYTARGSYSLAAFNPYSYTYICIFHKHKLTYIFTSMRGRNMFKQLLPIRSIKLVRVFLLIHFGNEYGVSQNFLFPFLHLLSPPKTNSVDIVCMRLNRHLTHKIRAANHDYF